MLLHVGVLADPDAELPDWWSDASQGGGWLGAHGSQVIDQLRVTLGEFAAVCASLPHVGPRAMTAEDGFIVQFRMASGCVGTMQSTCADRSPPMIETRVAGTEGALETDYERMIGLGLDIPPYTRLAECFRALIEGRPVPSRAEPARFRAGLAALRVLEAARRSAAEECWVRV